MTAKNRRRGNGAIMMPNRGNVGENGKSVKILKTEDTE
jgi:hypothetical protein